jgi:hypothetical protein
MDALAPQPSIHEHTMLNHEVKNRSLKILVYQGRRGDKEEAGRRCPFFFRSHKTKPSAALLAHDTSLGFASKEGPVLACLAPGRAGQVQLQRERASVTLNSRITGRLGSVHTANVDQSSHQFYSSREIFRKLQRSGYAQ